MPHFGHIHYREHGRGRPLVLLHGHTLDGRMWEPVVPLLASQYRLIIPDLAGHGQSQLSPQGASMAEDLAALLQHLKAPQVAVAGLSMGGAVAVSFCLHYPDMCSALIPVSSHVFGHTFDQWPGPRPYVKQARSQGLEPALDSWMADPLFAPVVNSRSGKAFREIVAEYPGTMWLTRTPPAYPPGPPESERLHEITAPTLICLGSRDLPDFHDTARLLAQEIPGAKLRLFPGAGHLVPMEQPHTFASALLSFLKRIRD